MAKPSSRRFQSASNEILSVAADLFDEQGYGQTSLQEIAERVGVSRPSLYHYFSSKEEILAALVDRSTARREEIIGQISASDDAPVSRLRMLLRLVGEATGSNPTGLRITLDNEAALADEVRRRSARSRRLLFDLLASILAEGVGDGSLRPLDERQVAATLIAALTGLQYRAIGGVEMSPEHTAQLLEEIIVVGLCQPADRQAASLDDALRMMREDLELVERHARDST
jgi:AcrR family transcriptional regulator